MPPIADNGSLLDTRSMKSLFWKRSARLLAWAIAALSAGGLFYLKVKLIQLSSISSDQKHAVMNLRSTYTGPHNHLGLYYYIATMTFMLFVFGFFFLSVVRRRRDK